MVFIIESLNFESRCIISECKTRNDHTSKNRTRVKVQNGYAVLAFLDPPF